MYLNLIQIAESLGVTEHVITDWVRKEGMPHVHDRGRILFEQSQVMEWAAKRGLAAHSGFLSESAPAQAEALSLPDLLRRGGIWRDVRPDDLPGVFGHIVANLPGLAAPVRTMLTQRLGAPNGITIAPVGDGFALPHPTMRVSLGEHSALVALILLVAPHAAIETPDGIPITRLLFFISPTPRLHVTMLGLLARSIATGIFQDIQPGQDDATVFQNVAQAWTMRRGLAR